MLEVVTRREWGAHEARSIQYLPDRTLVKYVFLVATHKNQCSTTESCKLEVKKTQERHISRFVPDIKYNFLIGGDGLLYEGRGFNVVASIPHTYYNVRMRSLLVAFMGEFDVKPPSQRMFDAFKQLMRTGIRRDYVAPKLLVFHL